MIRTKLPSCKAIETDLRLRHPKIESVCFTVLSQNFVPITFSNTLYRKTKKKQIKTDSQPRLVVGESNTETAGVVGHITYV